MAHIFAEILTWSKELTPWQNEAIRRLFRKGDITASDKDEIFQLARIEYGLNEKPAVALDLMLKSTELPSPPAIGQKIYLRAIRELCNVNALKNDQRVAIGKQFTIVYGENGVGKSGYARVTKRACRARAVDPILPNVYTGPSTQPASAIFEVEEQDSIRSEKWVEGASLPDCLSRFAVFDSKCGRVYVSADNELGVLPYGFDIIKGLGVITDEIKKKFLDIANPPNPLVLKPFLDETNIGTTLSHLSPSTDARVIKSLGEWTESHVSELAAKELELASLKAKSPQAIRDGLSAEIKRLQIVVTVVTTSLTFGSEEKLGSIRGNVENVLKFKQAVAAAAKLAFGEMNLPGIGGTAWRELILAAAAFSTEDAYVGQAFPAAASDAKCVLCLRPLDDQTRIRLKRFWDFIQDDVSNKLRTAITALNLDIDTLKRSHRDVPKEIVVLEDAFISSGSKVYGQLQPFYQSLALRIKAIEEAIKNNAWDSIPDLPEPPIEQCNNEIKAIQSRLDDLKDDQSIITRIKLLTTEIAGLKAKQRLNMHLKTVLDYLSDLKTADIAKQAGSKISTYAISVKATELQNKFVTEEFKRKVSEEILNFGIPRIQPQIDKKSEKGKVLLKLVVSTAGKDFSPDLIFSEGERTAISLACFLGELSVGGDNCGIILDDPVSSLDHRVREKLVKRLADEATRRQVIVFTHDLVFYRELVSACERQKVQYEFQRVESLGSTIGIVNDVVPWYAMKVGQRVQKLEEILGGLKKAENDGNTQQYQSYFRGFYSALRSTWERSVEELLFNQVVQRLEKEVSTLRLDGVFVDSESVTLVFQGMSRTSEMIIAHDHAVATNSTLPTVADISKDLSALKFFIEQQKAKIKRAVEQHANLKK